MRRFVTGYGKSDFGHGTGYDEGFTTSNGSCMGYGRKFNTSNGNGTGFGYLNLGRGDGYGDGFITGHGDGSGKGDGFEYNSIYNKEGKGHNNISPKEYSHELIQYWL